MHGCGPGPGAKDSSAQNHLIPKHGPKPMLFVFGDSYADTGNIRKSLSSSWKQPYGLTFPGKPAGRFSDGRVLTDYIGKSFKSFICIIIDSTNQLMLFLIFYQVQYNTLLFLKKKQLWCKSCWCGSCTWFGHISILSLFTLLFWHSPACIVSLFFFSCLTHSQPVLSVSFSSSSVKF